MGAKIMPYTYFIIQLFIILRTKSNDVKVLFSKC